MSTTGNIVSSAFGEGQRKSNAPTEAGLSTNKQDTKNSQNVQHSDKHFRHGNEGKIHITELRPPVPGEETYCSSSYIKYGLEKSVAQPVHCTELYYGIGEGCGDGLALVGSVEEGSPSLGGTPPPVRWSESLHHLLSDPVGVNLFTFYLNDEVGSCDSLNFWFACKGLHMQQEEPSILATIIWKRFIRNYTVKVSQETYTEINTRINKRCIDSSIFDIAKEEVEAEMARTTYPSFLKSDLYLSHLAESQLHPGGPDSPHHCEFDSSSPPVQGQVLCSMPSFFLPTVKEDIELDAPHSSSASGQFLKLTPGALAATVRHRSVYERRKPESHAGQYLHGGNSDSCLNPYHATYASGQNVSRQDSELQSLSSDALTDDTKSCTDSSLDGMSGVIGRPMNSRQLRRHYQKMRENARQNRDLALAAIGGGGLYSSANAVPGSYSSAQLLGLAHKASKASTAKLEPHEFAAMLIDKLEKLKREREAQEKVQESFKKIREGEDSADEYRKQHAFNSLPPLLLMDKLAQKIPLEDKDLSQSILDRHVSRVWQDSSSGSPVPASPRPKSPVIQGKSSLSNVMPNQLMMPKPALTGPHPSIHPGLAGIQLLPNHPLVGRHHPNPYHHSAHHHGRRRDQGPDAHSTFSSDSGNVADYYDAACFERVPPPHLLPKSRSMPEYMENYGGGMTSDGSGSSKRNLGSSGRRCRKAPADLTDSGVSVVSDSGPSLVASSASKERVQHWLYENVFENGRRAPHSRSTHTAAGSTSPGSVKVLPCGRKGSSSVIASSITGHNRFGFVENSGASATGTAAAAAFHCPEETRDPGPYSSAYLSEEKRRLKLGASVRLGCHAISEEASMMGRWAQQDVAATSSGSNRSTLKKQKAKHASSQGGDSTSGSTCTTGTSSVSVSSETTTIVYNFCDDAVPFITKVQVQPVTLRRFKQHLPKKGNYRFFFKKHCEEFGVVQEEITDENETLPLFDGRIFAQIRKAD